MHVSPMKILVVDDQKAVRMVMAAELASSGHHVLEAGSAASALEEFKKHRPDMVLLDVEMPDQDGYWVAQQIRAWEPANWTPIVFLSGLDLDMDLLRGIEAGGDDYLVKPVSSVVLRAKLMAMERLLRMRSKLVAVSEQLRLANQQLQHASDTDALTGLLNRRAFDNTLAHEIEVARQNQKPLTLVLCDIDHFKSYNDKLGHVEGDNCLKKMAQLLKGACIRGDQYATRYGGEEFALIMANTPRSGALTFARGLLRSIDKLAVPHPASSAAPYVTLSGGITTCIPDGATTVEGMVMRADDALYAAKARGRNRLFSFETQIDTLDLERQAHERRVNLGHEFPAA